MNETIMPLLNPLILISLLLVGGCLLTVGFLLGRKKRDIFKTNNELVKIFSETDVISVQGYNKDRQVIFWNRASENLFGYSEKEALGRNIEELIILEENREHFKKSVKNWVNHGVAITSSGLTLMKSSGEKVKIYSSHILRTNSENEVEIFSISIDLTDFRKAKSLSRQKELILQSVFESSPDIYFLMEGDGTIIDYRSEKNTDLYVPPAAFMGKKMQDVLPDDLAIMFNQKKIDVKNNDSNFTSYEYQLSISNRVRHFESRLSYIQEYQQFVAVIRDITLRKNLVENLVKNEMKYRSIFQSAVVAILVTDKKANILEWNKGAVQIFGYSVQEAVGMPLLKIIPIDFRDAHKEGFAKAITEKKLSKNRQGIEVKGLRKNGETFPINLTLGSWQEEGEMFFSGVILDITQRKETEEKILHQAHYDVLTDLPNRFLAMDRLAKMVNDAKRSNKLVAVVFLDLDDFKKVNDTLGHEMGDKLLVESASRLNSTIREGDTVARLGGDEFIVLLTGLKNAVDAQPVIENILTKFRRPFNVDGRELILTVSIGLSIYPEDGEEPSQLLRNADSAMYYAKDLGRNTYSFFTQSMNKEVSRRLLLEEQIHGALERNEFDVYFQPQFDIKNQNIIGVEALLRWFNPALGHVSPVEFIPIAEQTGLIINLGLFVLEKSLIACVSWHEIYTPKIRVAVNLSPRQFRDPELVNIIASQLVKYNLQACFLELEITEGVLMSGHTYIEKALNELSELGICIAMDDFGTGYSSLSYLRKYPFDILKIDRSFINDITIDPADKELVNATIVMARALNIKVIAEGIETEAQLSMLKELQCDIGQGYLVSRPLPLQEMTNFLTNKTTINLKANE